MPLGSFDDEREQWDHADLYAMIARRRHKPMRPSVDYTATVGAGQPLRTLALCRRALRWTARAAGLWLLSFLLATYPVRRTAAIAATASATAAAIAATAECLRLWVARLQAPHKPIWPAMPSLEVTEREGRQILLLWVSRMAEIDPQV